MKGINGVIGALRLNKLSSSTTRLWIMLENKYLEILKFRIYPTKEQVAYLKKELNFYKKYYAALNSYIKSKQVSSLYKFSYKEVASFCDEFRKAVRKKKFDFSKYYCDCHFSFAKENILKKYFFRKKENIKKYLVDKVTVKISDPSCFIMNGYFYLKNIPKFKIRPKVDNLGEISFVNITKKNEKYYLTVVRSLMTKNINKTNKACGIDIGFKDYATIYDSDDKVFKINFENKKVDTLISKASFYKKTLVNIENKNSNYAKSKNYKRILLKLERVYERISNIQARFFNELALNLVFTYDLITIEDLDFETLFRKRESKLNLQKNSFGKFFKILEEKAHKYKKIVLRANRTFMSSQICSACGTIHHEMKDYSIRTFKCECGYVADRDVNAAKNLMNYGVRQLRIQAINASEINNKKETESKI